MIRLLAEIQRKNQVSMGGMSDDLEEEQSLEEGQSLEEDQNVEGRPNLEGGQSVEVTKEEHSGRPHRGWIYMYMYT